MIKTNNTETHKDPENMSQDELNEWLANAMAKEAKCMLDEVVSKMQCDWSLTEDDARDVLFTALTDGADTTDAIAEHIDRKHLDRHNLGLYGVVAPWSHRIIYRRWVREIRGTYGLGAIT